MAGKAGDQPIIVIKRIKKGGHGHHGGAWKIAYADFVTAMMAFFLLMWLLGSTAKGDLNGIAEYFNTPLKVAMGGGSGAGDSASLVNGGGKDLSRQAGQVKEGDIKPQRKSINLQSAKNEVMRHEVEKLKALKNKIENVIQTSLSLQAFKNQIKLDLTNDGLRIQIIDEQNRPMFDSGKVIFKDYTRDILREIGRALNEVENKITIAGHTDNQPFAGGEKGYSNWELSSERANAARRELVSNGMIESKIIRVVGLASAVPLLPDNPLHPSNRRITITVMNKVVEEKLAENASVTISDGGEVDGAIQKANTSTKK
jgi:chemotaxis protein MotB